VITLRLMAAEYEHLVTTLEGCVEELTELERQHDWYATALIERLEDCLDLVRVTSE